MPQKWSHPAEMVNDAERLAAVRATGLLASPSEEAFDRLTKLATRITGAPVSFFSVIDADHDFFKSCYGAPEPVATARRVTGRSFCHFTVLGTAPLLVSDARTDERYKELPSVKQLGVVAYLGIPLHLASGHALGSFCVVDFQTRTWDPEQVEILAEFAKSTLREVELRIARADEHTMKDRLTSQIRDPLTALHLHTDLIEDAVDLDQVRTHVSRMRDSLHRIESFVVRVLGVGSGERVG